MPNFTMSDDHRKLFCEAANALCAVRTRTAELSFPLSRDQVAAGLWPAGELFEHFLALKKHGIDSLLTTRDPMFYVRGDGIEREVCIHMHQMNPPVMFPYAIQNAYSGREMIGRQEREGDGSDKLRFNMEVLDPRTYERLARWINRAVAEHRQAEMVRLMIREFLALAGCGHSVASIITRWPALKLVFEYMTKSGYGYASRAKESWTDRVRGVPAARDRWDWPKFGPGAEWREKHRRIMDMCDEMIVGAATMAAPQATSRMNATLVGWRRHPGEKI